MKKDNLYVIITGKGDSKTIWKGVFFSSEEQALEAVKNFFVKSSFTKRTVNYRPVLINQQTFDKFTVYEVEKFRSNEDLRKAYPDTFTNVKFD